MTAHTATADPPVAVGKQGAVPTRSRDAAIEELFASFYPRLAGWCARLTGPDQAHDVATEAFTRLVARWATVEQPQAWLYLTATNLVRDSWRKDGRERAALVRLRPVSETHDGIDVTTRTTVREVVLALPDRYREAVLLHYFADLPLAQVAALTGRAVGTVKRDLFDARGLMAITLGARP